VQLYRPLSVVDRFFTERLPSNNVAFDSDVHIAGVECPTLILHARDDPIVPVCLTKKVYVLSITYIGYVYGLHSIGVCVDLIENDDAH
jgi:pimeloyl-ACP methyl ester carboxylesterase